MYETAQSLHFRILPFDERVKFGQEIRIVHPRPWAGSTKKVW